MSTREQYLMETIRMAEQKLWELPEGRVRHKTGNVWRYTGPADFKTLKGPDNNLLNSLILRAYLEKLVRVAEQELSAITRYNQSCPVLKIEDVYDSLSECRKQFITPLVPTREQIVDDWLHQPYPSHNPVPLTDKFPTGVASCPYVRSKSELMEVQRMDVRDVAFLYEFPLTLIDSQGGVVTFYPDFTILNKETQEVFYWEHYGRMDDPDYLFSFKNKQELYACNGILGSQLYQTFESAKRPLTLYEVNAVIDDIKKRGG